MGFIPGTSGHFADYDRTQYIGFGETSYTRFSMWQSPSPVTIGNTVAETSILTGAVTLGTKTIPANFLRAGSMLYVRTKGIIINDLNATLKLKIKLGATTIYDSGAVTLIAQNASPVTAEGEFSIGVTVAG